jgi:hypothetical protein
MATASRRLWRAAKTGPGTTQSPPAGWSHAHPVEPARLPGAISQNGAREARVRSAALRAPLHPARRSAIIEIATGGSGGMSFRKSRIVVPSKHNQSTALRAFTQNYGHPPPMPSGSSPTTRNTQITRHSTNAERACGISVLRYSTSLARNSNGRFGRQNWDVHKFNPIFPSALAWRTKCPSVSIPAYCESLTFAKQTPPTSSRSTRAE